MEKKEPIPQDTAGIPSNGHSRPANLSSSLTLFWRVFLPVFGTVFFTGMLLAFWLIDEADLYLSYPVWWPRTAIAVIWAVWLYFVWKKLWPLKRIDADDGHLYVTNYWVTVRYPWTDVEQLESGKWLGRNAVTLHLKGAGRFGQQILFFPGSHYQEWIKEHEKAHLLLAN
ncbi:MAG: hypothetical protein EP344_04545 [Bacteroidetes bacterium]|nr:MAG: hypothetical protein EP344_04545 [Bacteroidota bacterium]